MLKYLLYGPKPCIHLSIGFYCVLTSASCSTWMWSLDSRTLTWSSGYSTLSLFSTVVLKPGVGTNVKPLINVNSCLISPPCDFAVFLALGQNLVRLHNNMESWILYSSSWSGEAPSLRVTCSRRISAHAP